jgi:hypothetical protein
MGNININESDTSISAGAYNGPIELGMNKWGSETLKPFTELVNTKFNDQSIKQSIKNNIKRVVGMWEKKDGSHKKDTHKVHTNNENINEWVELTDDLLNEDLAVWFGTKKKSKGSSQPKGPWVNICKKVDGKHPPCGRPDASNKAYPKCRAAGVAGKMSDDEKKRACGQKRRAEKSHDKSGTGNKPKMVSHKKRPTNEIIEGLVRRIITKL